MRAARLTRKEHIEILDLPVPDIAADEALVRVIAYGPYGTDVGHYLDRDDRYVDDYPIGIGADFSGIVAKIGAAVTNVTVGDRVSALALAHCGKCANCTRGKTNLCLDYSFYMGDRQICCQEFTVVPARKLAKLPDNVTFDDGAMLAGVVETLNGFEMMGVQPGDTMAIVGVGAMGLAAVGTAVALGLDVVAFGGRGARATLAKNLGARAVIPLKSYDENIAPAALALSPGGYKYVFESTVTQWGMKLAFAIAALEARVALTGGGQVPINGWDITQKELRIIGVRAGHHQAQAHALIAPGKLDLKPTIGARFPLEHADDAFKLLASPKAADIGRVIIDVGTP